MDSINEFCCKNKWIEQVIKKISVYKQSMSEITMKRSKRYPGQNDDTLSNSKRGGK